MRIALALVLLLAAFAQPARAQHAPLPSPQASLPAGLTPSHGTTAPYPPLLGGRRNRADGAFLGALAGGVTGALVANYIVCIGPSGEGGAEQICKAMGTGLGIVVGAIVGGIIGTPERARW